MILDAKRGDIGATAEQYAREAFERYRADAVTLSPFMGFDSIEPYLRHADKGLILLCRTSNPGGADLQAQPLAAGPMLYERIAELAQGPWNRSGQLGLVVGATYPGRDRARARARADAAAADPRRRRPGRRCGGHRARRLAPARRPDRSAPIIVSSSRAVLYAERAATTSPPRRAQKRSQLRRGTGCWPVFSWRLPAAGRSCCSAAPGQYASRPRRPTRRAPGGPCLFATELPTTKHARMAIWHPIPDDTELAGSARAVDPADVRGRRLRRRQRDRAGRCCCCRGAWVVSQRVQLVLMLVGFATAGGVLLGRSLRRDRIRAADPARPALPRPAQHRRRLVLGARPRLPLHLHQRAARRRRARPRCSAGSASTPWQLPDIGLSASAARRAPRRPRGAPAASAACCRAGATRTGRSRIHSISGEPRFDAGGVFLGYWGVARDVTEEVRAQRAIDRERDALPRAVRALAVAAAAAPQAASIFDANDAAARLFGFADAGGDERLRDRRPVRRPARTASASASASRALERMPVGEGCRSPTSRRRAIDGRPDQRAGRPRCASTPPTGPATLSILFDITARQRAEAALRRSEAMLSHLFATSPDCITLTELRQRPLRDGQRRVHAPDRLQPRRGGRPHRRRARPLERPDGPRPPASR